MKRLFVPLHMTGAGFGSMGTPGSVDEPWQHRATPGDYVPIPPGPRSDNPPVLNSAGRVHCTLADWAKFVQMHLAGEQGTDGLLRASTIKYMHRPKAGESYAFGWMVTERPWAGGTALTHAGSNTMNFCVVWMAPKRDFAVLVVTNAGGDEAAAACDEAASALIISRVSQAH